MYVYKLVYYNDVTTTMLHNFIIISYIIIIAQHAVTCIIANVYALDRMIFFFATIDVYRLHGHILLM